MHSNERWVALVALAVAFLFVLTPFTSVDAAWRMDEPLPAPVGMTCAVSTGMVMYVFGGATKGGLLDTIWAVDPESGRTSVQPFTLPSPRKLSSAVWTGDAAYVIGGIGYDAEPIPEIVKFVPGVGVSVIEGAMPYGTKGIPSVWSGEAVYILGNCLSSEVGQHDVIRFDPVNGTTEVLEDELPIPGAGSTATWAGDCAYIVGGRQNQTLLSDRIIKYVPGVGAEYMEARLPKGRIGAASVWTGSEVYAFGGTIALECGPLECVPTDYLDEMVIFDPANDTLEVYAGSLPRPMDLRAAVYFMEGEPSYSRVLIPGGLTTTGPIDWIMVKSLGPPPKPPEENVEISDKMWQWFDDNRSYVGLVISIFAIGGMLYVYMGAPFRRGEEGSEQYQDHLDGEGKE